MDDCPHGDTLDAAFRRLQPSEVQEAVTATVETLIRKKVLYPYIRYSKPNWSPMMVWSSP